MDLSVILSGLSMSFIFGFSFLFTKNALDYTTPFTFLSYRFFVAVFFMSLLIAFGVIKIEKKPYWKLWKVAIFQPVLYFIFETYGLQKTTSAEAGMLIALIPIVVNVLAIFILKEHGSILHYLFVFTSFLGVLLIVGFNFSGSNFIGKILVLFAVFSAALYNISSRKMSKEFKPYEITFFMMLTGFLVFFSLSLLKGEFVIVLNTKTVSSALYLGILSSALAFFLVNYMVSKASPIVTTLFSNLTTVVSVIAGVLFRREKIGLNQIIGMGIIILSILMITLISNKKLNKAKERT